MSPPAPPVGRTLRVLTYNVNFGIPGDASTLGAIRDAHADLALLQETNAGWERALRGAFAVEFPHMIFRNRGDAGGLAVLSRLPFRIDFLPPPEDGWFAAARVIIETSFGTLQVLSVHLHPPVSEGGSFLAGHFTSPPVRLNEMKSFFARLDPGYPTIIAGDFNEEEDGDVMKFLIGRGMTSALARYAPDRPTWRWKTVVGTLHRQLDHLVYDGRLEAVSAEVRETGRSDHLPVTTVITASGQGTAGPAPR